ncbi:MAG: transglutaminase-like domain-containing protein [Chloroflexota bacterium]
MPPNAGPSIQRVGLVTAGLLVVLAWGGPAFAQSEIAARLWAERSRPWTNLRERIGQTFGSLRSRLMRVSDYYGEALALSAGTEPGEALVMTVEPEQRPDARSRFYWRSRVYETYLDGEWTSGGQQLIFEPEYGDLPLAEYEGRRTYEFTTTVAVPSLRTLYVAAQPVWVSRPVEVSMIRLPDGSLDVLRVAGSPVVIEGEAYRSRASAAVPAADQLRAAGTDYPAWVLDRYLELPDTITARTAELAQTITAGLETPYDQAVAITHWLRSNIRYGRNTVAPPAGVEPIDWFLFDYRVGFCDYYASAEVILLRLLGIPAHLSAGFAEGTYRPQLGIYEVHGRMRTPGQRFSSRATAGWSSSPPSRNRRWCALKRARMVRVAPAQARRAGAPKPARSPRAGSSKSSSRGRGYRRQRPREAPRRAAHNWDGWCWGSG